MAVNRTQEEFARLVGSLGEKLKGQSDRIEIVALKRLQADITTRVFNKGLSTDEQPHDSKRKARQPRDGAYSKTQGRKRREGRRQTDKIDFEDEGTMRRRIDVGKSQGENSLGFLNDSRGEVSSGEIAGFHEEYRKKPIFRPTKKEFQRALKTAIKEGEVIISECILIY